MDILVVAQIGKMHLLWEGGRAQRGVGSLPLRRRGRLLDLPLLESRKQMTPSPPVRHFSSKILNENMVCWVNSRRNNLTYQEKGRGVQVIELSDDTRANELFCATPAIIPCDTRNRAAAPSMRQLK